MRVITTVDVDPAAEFAASRGVGFTPDYDAVLLDDRVDAVILCTPHSLHTDQIARAATAGKHVFCEKPLALTVARRAGLGRGLQRPRRRARRRARTPLQAPVLELARMVRSGELGTIMQSEATFTMDNLVNLKADNWRMSSAEAPAGPLTSLAIHAVDLCVSVHGRQRASWSACERSPPRLSMTHSVSSFVSRGVSTLDHLAHGPAILNSIRTLWRPRMGGDTRHSSSRITGGLDPHEANARWAGGECRVSSEVCRADQSGGVCRRGARPGTISDSSGRDDRNRLYCRGDHQVR